ncbi:MAG: histidine--tRNA ligase [Candidatus Pacebacteria bacterium]|nr:histidine--tRNA ligase [Candidatus Paceibacterota bacterium]
MTEKSKPSPKTQKMLSTEPYKGVRDFYPEDLFIQNYIFNIWRKTAESFGYVEYSASILESAELYRAKSGEEIINEQTYTFIDRGDREVTLRPEMTPTVARMVAGKRRELAFPLRWYSIPNVFRYERPQRGRLREHWQLNVDLFGVEKNAAEIELITLAHQIMKNFGAQESDFEIRISSRKLLNAIFNDWYELTETQSHALQKLIDRKNKMDADTFSEEAEKIVGKAFSFLDFGAKDGNHSAEAEQAIAFPDIRAAKEELDEVMTALQNNGIKNVVLDQELIRGFDYYTGIVFEVFDKNPENNRSLFGGGRYDELLSLFGHEKVAAVGFGMGDVTIANFLETRNLLPIYKSPVKVAIISTGISAENLDQADAYIQKVSTALRHSNISTVSFLNDKKNIGDQIKTADRQHIPYVIIIGPDEIAGEILTIKKLSTGEEKKTPLSSLAEIILYLLPEK